MSDDLLDLARAATASLIGEIARLAIAGYDQAVAADLEDQPRTGHAGRDDWIDTRPLLSDHEHAPQVVDMWRDALTYAHMRRLVVACEGAEHLVRIARGAR